jgi:hypothetical protein
VSLVLGRDPACANMPHPSQLTDNPQVLQLQARFEGLSPKGAQAALDKSGGHAGKAARSLRSTYKERGSPAKKAAPVSPQPAEIGEADTDDDDDDNDLPGVSQPDEAAVNLAARFVGCTAAEAQEALRLAGGHAGKAARALRLKHAPAEGSPGGSSPASARSPEAATVSNATAATVAEKTTAPGVIDHRTNLLGRFEDCTLADVDKALKRHNNHAGKAARELRSKFRELSDAERKTDVAVAPASSLPRWARTDKNSNAQQEAQEEAVPPEVSPAPR